MTNIKNIYNLSNFYLKHAIASKKKKEQESSQLRTLNLFEEEQQPLSLLEDLEEEAETVPVQLGLFGPEEDSILEEARSKKPKHKADKGQLNMFLEPGGLFGKK